DPASVLEAPIHLIRLERDLPVLPGAGARVFLGEREPAAVDDENEVTPVLGNRIRERNAVVPRLLLSALPPPVGAVEQARPLPCRIRTTAARTGIGRSMQPFLQCLDPHDERPCLRILLERPVDGRDRAPERGAVGGARRDQFQPEAGGCTAAELLRPARV